MSHTNNLSNLIVCAIDYFRDAHIPADERVPSLVAERVIEQRGKEPGLAPLTSMRKAKAAVHELKAMEKSRAQYTEPSDVRDLMWMACCVARHYAELAPLHIATLVVRCEEIGRLLRAGFERQCNGYQTRAGTWDERAAERDTRAEEVLVQEVRKHVKDLGFETLHICSDPRGRAIQLEFEKVISADSHSFHYFFG